jgi:hypothetical protein
MKNPAEDTYTIETGMSLNAPKRRRYWACPMVNGEYLVFYESDYMVATRKTFSARSELEAVEKAKSYLHDYRFKQICEYDRLEKEKESRKIIPL